MECESGDTVRGVRATGAERIGDRIRIEFVGREVAEIFSVDGERDENQETGEQEFHGAPPSCAFSLVLGWAGRQVRFVGLTYATPGTWSTQWIFILLCLLA